MVALAMASRTDCGIAALAVSTMGKNNATVANSRRVGKRFRRAAWAIRGFTRIDISRSAEQAPSLGAVGFDLGG